MKTADEHKIEELEKYGKRWTKYGKDRIYLNPYKCGLEGGKGCDLATVHGSTIPNAQKHRILNAKVYVDLQSEGFRVVSDRSWDDYDMVDAAKAIIA